MSNGSAHQTSFSNVLLRHCDQPRPDHRISLGAKLCVSVERNPVPSRADVGLHRLKAEASDLGHECNVTMPLGFLGFPLNTRSCTLRFHSFAIGLGSHSDYPPVVVVVRAGTVVGPVLAR